jgi:hypothetical protein
MPKNDGPTIPIGRIVEKRVCGIFGVVISIILVVRRSLIPGPMP